jgi:hypothetical protein
MLETDAVRLEHQPARTTRRTRSKRTGRIGRLIVDEGDAVPTLVTARVLEAELARLAPALLAIADADVGAVVLA